MKESNFNNFAIGATISGNFNNFAIGATIPEKKNIHHRHLFLRTIRIKNNELLINMSEKMGLGFAELSSIEHGRSSIPDGFFTKLYTLYELPIDFGDLELWKTLEQSLYSAKTKHEGIPLWELVIAPLIVRYESGERSSDLHAQILDVM